MTAYIKPTAHADVDGQVIVGINTGDIALDAMSVPYAQATIDVPITDDLDLNDLDPRTDTRVHITAGDDVVGSSRSFDLGLRARSIEHGDDARVVTLELASDEALTTDYATLVVDSGARAHEGSLRGICDYVLSKIPGLANLDLNPRAVASGSTAPYGARWGWTRTFPTSGAETIPMPFGTLCRFTTVETGNLSGRGVDSYGNGDATTPGTTGDWIAGPAVTPGSPLSVSRWVRIGSTAQATSYDIGVRFHNGAGAWVGGWKYRGAAPVPSPTSTWTRLELSVTVPAGATRFCVTTRAHATWTAGSFIDVTAIQAELTSRATAYKDVVLSPSDPGTPDVDMTAVFNATNLCPNPSFEVDVVGTGISVNFGSTQRVQISSPAGSYAARGTVQYAGNCSWYPAGSGNVIKVTPGVTYRLSCYVLSSIARATFPFAVFRDSAGAAVGATQSGPTATSSTTVWTRYEVVATAPANAASVWLGLQHNANTTGQFHYADGVLVVEDTGDSVPYFDGSTPGSSLYTYSWEGTAHASKSARLALVERPPELFVWTPGVTAWDFLMPFTSAANRRLFNDERRVWRLIDPGAYVVPGLVKLSGFNAARGSDVISRDDAEVFATGVVVLYSWTDAQGVQRTAYDSAGDPSKVVVIEYARAYPGPGAAAAILRRRNGTGRTQDVTALANWSATPGMEATVTLPGAPEQRGKLSRVVWQLDDTGLMDIGTRGLIDIVQGSIDALDGTIDAQVGSIDGLT